MKSVLSLALGTLMLSSCFLHANPLHNFSTLNAKREGRAKLIKQAIKHKEVYENENGLLKLRESPSKLTELLVNLENSDRKQQFQIIASENRQNAALVAQSFAEKNGFNPLSKASRTLSIHGSNTIGAKLMPALVKAYIKKLSESADVFVEKEGVETTIYYKSNPSEKNYSAIEIIAHGSSTAFGETKSNKKVGLAGGYADLGMASRPVKNKEAIAIAKQGLGNIKENGNVFPIAVDGVAVIIHPSNPIRSLTVTQIAQLFSGEITNWESLGGINAPVKIFSRDAQSGTFDTFKSRVLKPSGKKLSPSLAGRFEENSVITEKIGKEPNGIGFIGLNALNKNVKALSIQAAAGTRGFFPNRLTLKSLDYPLSRLLYIYAPRSRSAFAENLLTFIMSNEGQSTVDKLGLVGQGLATKYDKQQAKEFKNVLLTDAAVPEEYRKAIVNADREDTSFNVRFSSGSTEPDANSSNNLQRLVNQLANAGMDDVTVKLIGFTDSRGTNLKNLTLSKQRAETVANYLRNNGVTNITSLGFGEAMPVADNTVESGRAANRRVEVWLER